MSYAGINAVALNNVNADPRILRCDYLPKVAALEGELRHFRRVETLGLLTARLVHDLNNLLVPMLVFSRDLASELEERGQRRAARSRGPCR